MKQFFLVQVDVSSRSGAPERLRNPLVVMTDVLTGAMYQLPAGSDVHAVQLTDLRFEQRIHDSIHEAFEIEHLNGTGDVTVGARVIQNP